MFYELSRLRISCPLDVVLSVPLYISKGRPRLQGVGIRISLDRGIALAYLRLPYRHGLELSCYGVLW